MHEIAEEICRLAGLGRQRRSEAAAAARPHPGRGRPVRARPARRPRHRRGALPGVRALRRAAPRPPTSRCRAARARPRSATATARPRRRRIWKRLDDELETIRGAGLRLLLPHRRRRHRPDRRDGHPPCRPRLRRRQPGQLPPRRLRRRPDPPRPADGAVPLAAARLAARHRRRRRVGAPRGGLPRRSSTATAASGAPASR